MRQLIEDLGDDIDLLEGAEESRIERVETYIQALPMVHDGPHIAGQIAIGESLESSGMGGKDGCREHRAFHASGGDYGQCDGQRASSDA